MNMNRCDTHKNKPRVVNYYLPCFLEISSLKFYRDSVINEIQLLDTNSQIQSDMLNRDPHLFYVISDKYPADQI